MDDLMLRSPRMGESDEGWGEGIKYMQILMQRLNIIKSAEEILYLCVENELPRCKSWEITPKEIKERGQDQSRLTYKKLVI